MVSYRLQCLSSSQFWTAPHNAVRTPPRSWSAHSCCPKMTRLRWLWQSICSKPDSSQISLSVCSYDRLNASKDTYKCTYLSTDTLPLSPASQLSCDDDVCSCYSSHAHLSVRFGHSPSKAVTVHLVYWILLSTDRIRLWLRGCRHILVNTSSQPDLSSVCLKYRPPRSTDVQSGPCTDIHFHPYTEIDRDAPPEQPGRTFAKNRTQCIHVIPTIFALNVLVA